LKTGLKHIVFLIFLLFLFLRGTAQGPVISIKADGESLAEILENVAETHEIRFAFDPETFDKTEASFMLENVLLSQFLSFLESRFGVTSKEIDGTWILIMQEKPVAELPKPPEPETVLVSGYIKDKNTGENLIYCNVASENDMGGMTNELGFFSFSIPAQDSVRLLVSYLGYHKVDTLVSTRINSVIYLEPSEIMLKPIRVVHTEREVLQASPQAEKIAFNPLKSSNVPRISNDDMGNALLLIPGVNFLQGGSSGLSIRGGAPTDNLVLFDGIPVLETSHLLGNISVLNARFVQQAFVSRGGFDAGYGGRVSGLIELTGKSGKLNKPYIDLSANLLNTNALVNLPVGEKFSVTAAWRRSFVDSWQNYLYYRLIDNVTSTEQNPVTSTIIPMVKYQDVNAKMSYHPSDNLEFNLNFLYGSDRQSRDFELIQTKDYYRNESMDSENLGMSFNWKWQVNSQWYHSFSAGFSGLEKNAVDETGELKEFTEVIENPGKGKGIGLGPAKTRERTFTRLTYDNDNGYNNIEEYRASWKTEFKSGAFRNEAGAGWTFNRFNYNFVASRLQETVKIDSIASKSELNMLSAFFQQHINLAEDFRFRWGLRTSFDVSRQNVYWQPRGGLEILPLPGLNFIF
jgi:ferric enterobactin receptor